MGGGAGGKRLVTETYLSRSLPSRKRHAERVKPARQRQNDGDASGDTRESARAEFQW